jgi:phage shock protein PspC (stress-responsive transcriptional regulator)
MGKLTRSNNSMVAGVCAGIAKYFGWDPTIVRIIYVLASVFTAFTGVLVYAILWILIPKE